MGGHEGCTFSTEMRVDPSPSRISVTVPLVNTCCCCVAHSVRDVSPAGWRDSRAAAPADHPARAGGSGAEDSERADQADGHDRAHRGFSQLTCSICRSSRTVVQHCTHAAPPQRAARAVFLAVLSCASLGLRMASGSPCAAQSQKPGAAEATRARQHRNMARVYRLGLKTLYLRDDPGGTCCICCH